MTQAAERELLEAILQEEEAALEGDFPSLEEVLRDSDREAGHEKEVQDAVERMEGEPQSIEKEPEQGEENQISAIQALLGRKQQPMEWEPPHRPFPIATSQTHAYRVKRLDTMASSVMLAREENGCGKATCIASCVGYDAIGTSSGMILVFDSNQKYVYTVPAPAGSSDSYITTMAFAKQSSLLLSGTRGGDLLLYHVEQRKAVHTMARHFTAAVRHVQLITADESLASIRFIVASSQTSVLYIHLSKTLFTYRAEQREFAPDKQDSILAISMHAAIQGISSSCRILAYADAASLYTLFLYNNRKPSRVEAWRRPASAQPSSTPCIAWKSSLDNATEPCLAMAWGRFVCIRLLRLSDALEKEDGLVVSTAKPLIEMDESIAALCWSGNHLIITAITGTMHILDPFCHAHLDFFSFAGLSLARNQVHACDEETRLDFSCATCTKSGKLLVLGFDGNGFPMIHQVEKCTAEQQIQLLVEARDWVQVQYVIQRTLTEATGLPRHVSRALEKSGPQLIQTRSRAALLRLCSLCVQDIAFLCSTIRSMAEEHHMIHVFWDSIAELILDRKITWLPQADLEHMVQYLVKSNWNTASAVMTLIDWSKFPTSTMIGISLKHKLYTSMLASHFEHHFDVAEAVGCFFSPEGSKLLDLDQSRTVLHFLDAVLCGNIFLFGDSIHPVFHHCFHRQVVEALFTSSFAPFLRRSLMRHDISFLCTILHALLQSCVFNDVDLSFDSFTLQIGQCDFSDSPHVVPPTLPRYVFASGLPTEADAIQLLQDTAAEEECGRTLDFFFANEVRQGVLYANKPFLVLLVDRLLHDTETHAELLQDIILQVAWTHAELHDLVARVQAYPAYTATCLLLLRAKGDYADFITLGLSSSIHWNQLMKSICDDHRSGVLTVESIDQVRSTIQNRFSELFEHNAVLSTRLLLAVFPDLWADTLSSFNVSEDAVFRLLEAAFTQWQDLAYANINDAATYHLQLIHRICIQQPDSLLLHLASHPGYDAEQVLHLCRIHDIHDAAAYLLEHLDKAAEALDLLLDIVHVQLQRFDPDPKSAPYLAIVKTIYDMSQLCERMSRTQSGIRLEALECFLNVLRINQELLDVESTFTILDVFIEEMLPFTSGHVIEVALFKFGAFLPEVRLYELIVQISSDCFLDDLIAKSAAQISKEEAAEEHSNATILKQRAILSSSDTCPSCQECILSNHAMARAYQCSHTYHIRCCSSPTCPQCVDGGSSIAEVSSSMLQQKRHRISYALGQKTESRSLYSLVEHEL